MNALPVTRLFDMLSIFVIVLVSVIAFVFQFFLNELPCPLCLLQRVGILAIAIGFLMNMRYGRQPGHYALSLVAALFTAVVAGRQVLLHITPGDEGYGLAIFGIHMYSWSFLLASGFIVLISCLLFAGLWRKKPLKTLRGRHNKLLVNTAFSLILGLALLNCVLVFMQCGFAVCVANPVSYSIF